MFRYCFRPTYDRDRILPAGWSSGAPGWGRGSSRANMESSVPTCSHQRRPGTPVVAAARSLSWQRPRAAASERSEWIWLPIGGSHTGLPLHVRYPRLIGTDEHGVRPSKFWSGKHSTGFRIRPTVRKPGTGLAGGHSISLRTAMKTLFTRSCARQDRRRPRWWGNTRCRGWTSLPH
jgi:hypothetical protein